MAFASALASVTWPPSPLVAFTAAFVSYHLVHSLGIATCGRQNARAPLYVTSAAHAIAVSGGALFLLARHGALQWATRDAFAPGGPPAPGAVDPSAGAALNAISLAYFAYDAITTLPDWRSHPLEVVHHAIGLLLTGGTCLMGDVPARVAHHVLVTGAWYRVPGVARSQSSDARVRAVRSPANPPQNSRRRFSTPCGRCGCRGATALLRIRQRRSRLRSPSS